MPESKSEAYSRIYNAASKCLTVLNPCNIRVENGRTVCTRGDIKWCCEGCKHLGPAGCTVESLACKLWLCQSAYIHLQHITKRSREQEEALRQFKELRDESFRVPHGFRMSKQENFLQ